MIIQCPNCDTKFSIDGALVAEVENPRFHCSRCDHYFEHATTASQDTPERQLSLLPEEPTPKEDWEVSEENYEPDLVGDEDESEDLHSENNSSLAEKIEVSHSTPQPSAWSRMKPEKASNGGEFEISELVRVPLDEELVPRQETSQSLDAEGGISDGPSHIQESSMSDSSEQPEPIHHKQNKTLGITSESSANTESTTESWRIAPLPKPNLEDLNLKADTGDKEDIPAADWPEEISFQRENALLSEDRVTPGNLGSTNSDSFDVGELESEDFSDQIVNPDSTDYHDEDFIEEEFVAEEEEKRFYSPLLLFCSFPAAFLCFLAIWSVNLDYTPSLVAEVFALKTENLPKVPPAGLSVTDLQSQLITLDEGTQVLEISGNIENAETTKFRDIRVQAHIFGDANNKLSTRIVYAVNGLGSASSLSALTPATIESLQLEPGLTARPLKPNGKIPFRVIFTENVSETAWFSARTYSAVPTN